MGAQKEKSDRATMQFLRRRRHRNAARFWSYRWTRSLWPDLAASALVQLSAVLLFSWSLISSYPRVSRCCRRSTEKRSQSRSEEHTSELQSLMRISYAVFCLKKKTNKKYKNY